MAKAKKGIVGFAAVLARTVGGGSDLDNSGLLELSEKGTVIAANARAIERVVAKEFVLSEGTRWEPVEFLYQEIIDIMMDAEEESPNFAFRGDAFKRFKAASRVRGHKTPDAARDGVYFCVKASDMLRVNGWTKK